MLAPSREAVAARAGGRRQRIDGPWSAERFHDGFMATTPRAGLWLDTSELTPEQTVDAILARSAAVR